MGCRRNTANHPDGRISTDTGEARKPPSQRHASQDHEQPSSSDRSRPLRELRRAVDGPHRQGRQTSLLRLRGKPIERSRRMLRSHCCSGARSGPTRDDGAGRPASNPGTASGLAEKGKRPSTGAAVRRHATPLDPSQATQRDRSANPQAVRRPRRRHGPTPRSSGSPSTGWKIAGARPSACSACSTSRLRPSAAPFPKPRLRRLPPISAAAS